MTPRWVSLIICSTDKVIIWKRTKKTSFKIPTTILNEVLQIEWNVAVSDFDKTVTKIQNSKKICLKIQNFPWRAMKGYLHKKSVKIRKKKSVKICKIGRLDFCPLKSTKSRDYYGNSGQSGKISLKRPKIRDKKQFSDKVPICSTG